MPQKKKGQGLLAACSAAIETLVKEPPVDHGGVFTEIDVLAKAGTKDWSLEDLKKAMRQANQACGVAYRSRKLCRYGPVVLPDGNVDYARIANKIVYADAETGPVEWETPNGIFPKMMVETDPISRQGRRYYANRTDIVRWDTQDVPAAYEPTRSYDNQRRMELLQRKRELEEQLAEVQSELTAPC